jgi:hypothetical protein
MAFGVVLSVFVLFAHLDPYCTETMADGTVRQTDPADQGMSSGWRFGSTNLQSTETSESGVEGPVSSYCTSDQVVWGEAAASLLISLAVFGAGLRWPVNSPRAVTAPGPIGSPNVR